jgi:membrane-associated phospholipid phosphatase
VTGGLGAEFRPLRDAAVCLGAALALGLLALTGPVTAFDDQVVELVRTVQAGWLKALFLGVHAVASLLPGVLILLGAVLVVARPYWSRAARWALTVMLGGWAIAAGLSVLLDRPPPTPDGWSTQLLSGSYPSVQVAFAMGCAVAALGLVRHRYRTMVIAGGAATVGLIGLASLYLGVHHLTDLLGAVLVSAAVTALVGAFRPTPADEDRLPGWPQR